MRTYLQRLRYKIAMVRFVGGTEKLAHDLGKMQRAARLAAIEIRRFASVVQDAREAR